MNTVTIFTKQRLLTSILSRPNQPQSAMDITVVVYQNPCSVCPTVYTGETGRTSKITMVGHKCAVRLENVNNGIGCTPPSQLGEGQGKGSGEAQMEKEDSRGHSHTPTLQNYQPGQPSGHP